MKTIIMLLACAALAVLPGDNVRGGASEASVPPGLELSVAMSELVIHGTVAGLESILLEHAHGKEIQTLVIVDLAEVLKGEARSPVTFRTLGGRVADLVDRVSNRPSLEVGDECIFFLIADDAGELFHRGTTYFLAEGRSFGFDRRPIDWSAGDLLEAVRGFAGERSFAAAAEAAAAVIEGTVASLVDNRLDRVAPLVEIEIAGLAVHKGAVQDTTVRISMTPATYEGSAYDIPEFREGERILVALSLTEDGTYQVVNGWEGKLSRIAGGMYQQKPLALGVPPLPLEIERRADVLGRPTLDREAALQVARGGSD